MLNKLNSFSSKTALVYAGAAFLILVVGFRTIILTVDEGDIGGLTVLTLFAIVLEFCLLIYYAYSIHELGDKDKTESIEVDMDFSELEKDIKNLNATINSLNISLDSINNLDTEFTINTNEFESVSNNLVLSIEKLENEIELNNENSINVRDILVGFKESVDQQNSKLEKILDGTFRQEIRNEINTILQKSLLNED